MKKVTKILFLLSALTVGLLACSKEKQIKHWLTRKDGKWFVTSMDYKYYNNNTLQQSSHITSPGDFVFSKNGSVVTTLNMNGTPQKTSGTWTNTKHDFTIMSNGEASVFTFQGKPKKDKMTVQTTDYYPSGEKEEYTLYMELAK